MYFNKNVDQLTMVDGAFLAGLIRAPSGYDPFRYPDRSKARREQALERLVADRAHDRGPGRRGQRDAAPGRARSGPATPARPPPTSPTR